MGLSSGNSLIPSASGGGSSTASQIQAVSDYEFIKKYTVQQQVSEFAVTDGIDTTKFGTHYFVCEDLKLDSSEYPIVNFSNTNSVKWNGTIFNHRHTTSYAYSSTATTSSGNFYLNGSQQYTSTDIFNMDIEVTQTTSRVHGFTRTTMGRMSGHWPQFTTGNFIIDRTDGQTSGNFGGFTIKMPLSQGTIKIYGRRIRTT